MRIITLALWWIMKAVISGRELRGVREPEYPYSNNIIRHPDCFPTNPTPAHPLNLFPESKESRIGEKYGIADVRQALTDCIGVNIQKTKEIVHAHYGKDFDFL